MLRRLALDGPAGKGMKVTWGDVRRAAPWAVRCSQQTPRALHSISDPFGSARLVTGIPLSSEGQRRLERYADRPVTPVTIQQMLVLNKQRLQSAPLLREELMVRVAKRYKDMEDMPHGLIETPQMKRVINMYGELFEALSQLERPDSAETDAIFTNAIENFYIRDAATLPAIAMGMRAWKRSGGYQKHRPEVLNARLDDLFTARLSIRMLIGQHCQTPGHAKIRRGLRVASVVEEAAETTKAMCLTKFGVCPDINIVGHKDFKFTYVHSHLHHMLFELLKNSVRAVVEQHHGDSGTERRKRLRMSSKILGNNGLPKVAVVISGGKEDVVIKVSDEGGGIPRSDLGKIWNYQYTTAGDNVGQDQNTVTNQQGSNDAPFITFRENFYGMGYGLPIARVFARYFGGDLKVISTEGWGTDAYIYINRLESAAVEQLPY